jgi:hypothetical protein
MRACAIAAECTSMPCATSVAFRISHLPFATSMTPATLLRLISLLPITAILVAVVLAHREPATERAMR